MKIDLEGYIAICKRGYMGVITGYDHKFRVYTGYSIDERNPGARWESKSPHVVESMDGLRAKAENSESGHLVEYYKPCDFKIIEINEGKDKGTG